MYKIQFSVLSYYPSIMTNENVNVGILFHNLTTDERTFHIMKNWNRLESFDDELDIEFMKKYLLGIKNECEQRILNCDKAFSLQEYIKFYVNELKFCNIKEVDITDVDDFILMTKKVHMRLDFDKAERLSRDNEVKYIKMMMKSNQVKYSAKAVTGGYNENVQYDYMVHNYGFKNFTFEDKKISKLIMNAKAWAHTAEATKEKYKTIFVYDIEKDDSPSYNIIMNILGEHAYKVMPSSDVLDYVISLQREENMKYQPELVFKQ